MTSRTLRDRDAIGFTSWLRQAARDGGVVEDLVNALDQAPGSRGRDFTPDELFDYLLSVGATRFAYDVVIPAAAASGYRFADGKSCPVTQDPGRLVRPFRPWIIHLVDRDDDQGADLREARALG